MQNFFLSLYIYISGYISYWFFGFYLFIYIYIHRISLDEHDDTGRMAHTRKQIDTAQYNLHPWGISWPPQLLYIGSLKLTRGNVQKGDTRWCGSSCKLIDVNMILFYWFCNLFYFPFDIAFGMIALTIYAWEHLKIYQNSIGKKDPAILPNCQEILFHLLNLMLS